MRTNRAAPTQEEDEQLLVARWETLIWKIAEQLPRKGGDEREDLFQDGAIGLIEGYRSYDPQRSEHLKTHLGLSIRRAMLDGIRERHGDERTLDGRARREAEKTIEYYSDHTFFDYPNPVAHHRHVAYDLYGRATCEDDYSDTSFP